MFYRWMLDEIFEKGNFSQSGFIKEGKLVSSSLKEVEKVLSFEELFSKCGMELVRAGYRVERCAPWRANAVIRVYRDEGWEHDDSIHWIYGATVYLKNFGVYFDSRRTMIDHKVFEVRWLFYQDDTPVVAHNFVDYYVRITKAKH